MYRIYLSFFRRFSILFILVVGCYTASVAQDLDSLIQEVLPWISSSDSGPGIAAAAIDGEGNIFQTSFGNRDVDQGTKIDENTVFDLASLSKQFTGFAIAQLVISGKLDLDDSVISFLPELKGLSSELKIEHLLSHTSGLREVETEFAMGNHGCIYSREKCMELLRDQRFRFKRKRKYDYTNTNYLLLALVVEKLTGTPFNEWCAINIFKPLKMDHTFVNYQPCEMENNMARGYYQEDKIFTTHEHYGIPMIGSSAVHSTLSDMTKWLSAFMNNDVFPEEFQMMKSTKFSDLGSDYHFGLVSMTNSSGKYVINHMGFARAGFRSLMAIFPKERKAVVVLTNWGDLNPDVVTGALISKLHD